MKARIAGLAVTLSTVVIAGSACGSSKDDGSGTFGGGSTASTGSTANAGTESSKSANQIVSDAKGAAGQAASVHVTGSISGSPLDVVATQDGRAQGTVPANDGGSIKFVLIGPDTCYAASDKSNGQFVKQTDSSTKEFASNFTMKVLVGEAITPTGAITKAGTATVNGQAAVNVQSARGGVLSVADNSAQPYPLKLVNPARGQLNFADWGKQVTISIPPNTTGS